MMPSLRKVMCAPTTFSTALLTWALLQRRCSSLAATAECLLCLCASTSAAKWCVCPLNKLNGSLSKGVAAGNTPSLNPRLLNRPRCGHTANNTLQQKAHSQAFDESAAWLV